MTSLWHASCVHSASRTSRQNYLYRAIGLLEAYNSGRIMISVIAMAYAIVDTLSCLCYTTFFDVNLEILLINNPWPC